MGFFHTCTVGKIYKYEYTFWFFFFSKMFMHVNMPFCTYLLVISISERIKYMWPRQTYSRVSLLDVDFWLSCFAFTHNICERLFCLFLTKTEWVFITIWTGFKTSVMKLHLIQCCMHNIYLWVWRMMNRTGRRQTFNITFAMSLNAWDYFFYLWRGIFPF